MTDPVLLFSDNATTTITGSITNTSVTVSLQAGTGVLFPNPGGGEGYKATFYDALTGLINEIVLVTGMSGDVATIVRAQEGTSARAWNAGDSFSNLMTAGTMGDFVQWANYGGPWLPLTGGTLTGNLTIASSATSATMFLNKQTANGNQADIVGMADNLNRWDLILGSIQNETGSNLGSNFFLTRYNDGGSVIDSPIYVDRALGIVQFCHSLNMFVINPGEDAVVNLSKSESGQFSSVYGRVNISGTSTLRWAVILGDNNPETGSNVGSDFRIDRYSDAGTFLNTVMDIPRGSGEPVFYSPVVITAPSSTNANFYLNKPGTGQASSVIGQNMTLARWDVTLGDTGVESGSNAGSNFSINRYADSGSAIDAPLVISRATGIATFEFPIVDTSDMRLKTNFRAIQGALGKIQCLEGLVYERVAKPGVDEIGLIAQDVQRIIPEVVSAGENGMLGVSYGHLVALLIEGIKELSLKVEQLKRG